MEAVKYHITKLLAAELNEWNINSEGQQIAAVLPFDRKIIFNQFIEEYLQAIGKVWGRRVKSKTLAVLFISLLEVAMMRRGFSESSV
ncbi:hypothetical protein CEXT_240761 [Caerostris extrusa]|uniref:Uncharacterized protein n=1 Tax=Caerostris extrusa TaxID=172846 RepID=A0AAV4XD79_CAEEX|nr:hypothetical protein CEXT_240761 [Caerostris extrusa]